MFLRDAAIVLVIIAVAAAIYHFKHHGSVRNHVSVAADVETLNVEKGDRAISRRAGQGLRAGERERHFGTHRVGGRELVCGLQAGRYRLSGLCEGAS